MSKNNNKPTANDEKKVRAIKQTNRTDFVNVIASVFDILNEEGFEDAICKKTGNGLYKFSTTVPTDMTGVKKEDVSGLTWYLIPTNDYRISFTSYLQFRLTANAKAKSALLKKLGEMSVEELQALLGK